MALRLVELYLPLHEAQEARVLLEGEPLVTQWSERSEDDVLHLSLLIASEHANAVLDIIEKRFKSSETFRVIVLPVEATIPRIDPDDEDQKKAKERHPVGRTSVSREELYEDISASARPTRSYMLMIILASIVAGIGILRNNVAIIVGAMVIAPLLGPNVALCLSTTLADWKLMRRSLISLLLGIGLALLFACAWGAFLTLFTDSADQIPRVSTDMSDIALALASGCAGVLAFTLGTGSALVGVMVAVALLPPLVTAGLHLGQGDFSGASGSLAVFLINVICINLAGVLTFLVQGVGPLMWWEKRKARKSVVIALSTWVLLLLVLVFVILIRKASTGD